MKKSAILTIALLALLLMAQPAPAASCTTTVAAGGDIQAAINSATPGDVICLDPGTYSPGARININKSVTLQGPQAGVDPRPTAGTARTPGDTSTEAIVDGGGVLPTIFRITADNVVLDGLEVRNGAADLIDSPTGAGISGVVIRYTIIRDALGDEAIQLRDCTDCFVEFNHIFDIAEDGINMCCGSTGGVIQFNEVHDNHSENAAIYVYESTDMTIECNLVYDVFENDGIKLGSKGGGDAARTGGSILYNIVHHTVQDGITVYMSSVLVDGNEVYNTSGENGAIYVAFGVSDVAISNNSVHDNTLQTFKWGNPGAVMIGTGVDASTVHVNNNNILANSPNGVTNKASALLDAESNWWNAADGPAGAGPGSGDSASTNVDFDPWLTEPRVIANPCEPQAIEVDIDIKAGSDPNSINLKSKGVVPVAVLTTADFDASTVDPGTVLFAGVSPVRWTLEDVDGDGDLDLLFHFKTQELNLDETSTEATLTGETTGGVHITGTDTVNIVPKDK